ncbi:MAG TPA: FtsX-like permease family protein [Chryseosolibacter sp.]|nr:FtsX-like permease family protein [Chryseosolibacter sp.]
MFLTYMKIAVRSLWKNKFHSTINILGLAVGISACLVIYLLVTFELSFNKGFPDYDRTYRLHSSFEGNFVGLNRGVPAPVGAYSREHLRGIESTALVIYFGTNVEVPSPQGSLKLDDRQHVAFVDDGYFAVFNAYEWLQGSPETLKVPGQVVITETQYRKYFGTLEPSAAMGREIIYSDSLVVHVGGIVKDLAFNSDLQFSDFISLPTIESEAWLKAEMPLDNWNSISSSTQVFVKAAKGVEHGALLSQLPDLAKYYDERNFWPAKNDFYLQPLSDLHFNVQTGIFDFSRPPAHKPTLLTLTGVAILLLIIGSINFINLVTAQSLQRAKEVGMRKVMGSTRLTLVIQFLAESMLLIVVAIALALPLANLSLNVFSEFIPPGAGLNIQALLPFLLFIVLFVGLLASSYPAFVMSSFKPALALKMNSQVNVQSDAAMMRKMLIVFQFAVAQLLIVGTLVVDKQVRFLLNKDLGFRKDAVVYFFLPEQGLAKNVAVKTAMEQLPDVEEISLSESPPAFSGWSSTSITHKSPSGKLDLSVHRRLCDEKFLDFYGIELLAGRNVAPSDSVREFLVNESLMKELGFSDPQAVLGEFIEYGPKKVPIVGVIRNFHQQSLHYAVDPLVMSNAMAELRCVNVRVNAGEGPGALNKSVDRIKTAWQKIFPDQPLQYQFLDETIANFYRTEQRTLKLSRTAMGLAILISCLGLFALASFTTVRRTKEIGIRKIHGASPAEIVALLSKDFITLVAIAFVVASPVAWLVINAWLDGFSHRIGMNAWLFISTLALATTLAFVTVAYQSLTAARKNPAESLRSE